MSEKTSRGRFEPSEERRLLSRFRAEVGDCEGSMTDSISPSTSSSPRKFTSFAKYNTRIRESSNSALLGYFRLVLGICSVSVLLLLMQSVAVRVWPPVASKVLRRQGVEGEAAGASRTFDEMCLVPISVCSTASDYATDPTVSLGS